MAQGKGLDWKDRSRSVLETLAKEGYCVADLAEALGVSQQTVRSELMRGMDEEDYKRGRYPQYSAEASVKKQVEAYEKKIRGIRSEE